MTPLLAVAVVRALVRDTGLGLRIKKPNDVFCGSRKLAGILSEARTGSAVFVVAGVGINVNHDAGDFPLELRETATSLARETGCAWAREALAAGVLREIQGVYDPGRPPDARLLGEYEALSRGPVCDSFPP
jgi:BirA family biotin operon repressor/biotin-[acetyl-CoA-carboxylase] ligase